MQSYISIKNDKSFAWNIIGSQFWRKGRITARPSDKDINSFLKGIPPKSKCTIIGASTKYLIDAAIKRNLNVTVMDFSNVMLDELEKENGNVICQYILHDILEEVPECLLHSQEYVISERLINRFSYEERTIALRNMTNLLKIDGEIRSTIRLGLYPMDLRLIKYGHMHGNLTDFYDDETKTIDFSKTKNFLRECIVSHGDIAIEILYQWYIGRKKESRLTRDDVLKMMNDLKLDCVEESVCSEDNDTVMFCYSKKRG